MISTPNPPRRSTSAHRPLTRALPSAPLGSSPHGRIPLAQSAASVSPPNSFIASPLALHVFPSRLSLSAAAKLGPSAKRTRHKRSETIRAGSREACRACRCKKCADLGKRSLHVVGDRAVVVVPVIVAVVRGRGRGECGLRRGLGLRITANEPVSSQAYEKRLQDEAAALEAATHQSLGRRWLPGPPWRAGIPLWGRVPRPPLRGGCPGASSWRGGGCGGRGRSSRRRGAPSGSRRGSGRLRRGAVGRLFLA